MVGIVIHRIPGRSGHDNAWRLFLTNPRPISVAVCMSKTRVAAASSCIEGTEREGKRRQRVPGPSLVHLVLRSTAVGLLNGCPEQL